MRGKNPPERRKPVRWAWLPAFWERLAVLAYLLLITAAVGLVDRTPNMIVVGVSGMGWVVFTGFSLIGIIAGIYSCLEKGKSRIPAAVGIGVNALVLLFTIAIMMVGILSK